MPRRKFLITGATGREVDHQIVGRYLPAVVSNERLDPAPTEAFLREPRRTVARFEAILGTGAFLAGGQCSLADIALACLIDNLTKLADARLIVPKGAALRNWCNRIRVPEVFLAARPKAGLPFGLPSIRQPAVGANSNSPSERAGPPRD